MRSDSYAQVFRLRKTHALHQLLYHKLCLIRWCRKRIAHERLQVSFFLYLLTVYCCSQITHTLCSLSSPLSLRHADLQAFEQNESTLPSFLGKNFSPHCLHGFGFGLKFWYAIAPISLCLALPSSEACQTFASGLIRLRCSLSSCFLLSSCNRSFVCPPTCFLADNNSRFDKSLFWQFPSLW